MKLSELKYFAEEALQDDAEDTDAEIFLQLIARIEGLSEALKSIAALQLEPFCAELFDSPWEELHNDTMIAREALAQFGPEKEL